VTCCWPLALVVLPSWLAASPAPTWGVPLTVKGGHSATQPALTQVDVGLVSASKRYRLRPWLSARISSLSATDTVVVVSPARTSAVA
jgi:hypothetical protein